MMPEPRKIFVGTEQFKGRLHDFQPLIDAGFEIDINENDFRPTEDELIESLKGGTVATIAGGEPYTERVFASTRDLRIVARWGVGYDMVDVAAATRHGIPVAMAFNTNHESVAEYAHGMALTLACRLAERDRAVRAGRWGFDDFHPGLWGRTAGIIGFGRIGRAMAERCRGCKMQVVVYDPFADAAVAAKAGVRLVPLDELLEAADLVSVHAPVTPETRHLMGREQFRLMKRTAILVNTSRGPLIDEEALIEALVEGQIAAAGLDVYEVEPLQAGSRLRELDNVILSPHVSGMDKMAERNVTQRCMDNILAFLAGRHDEIRPYVLNPETLNGSKN